MKKDSKTRLGKIAVPTGVVGLSLAVAGVASPAQAAQSPQQPTNLHEQEIADISLGSFYVADKENPGGVRAQGEMQMAWWRCRCWRCGCWRCRCRRCGCA